MSFVLYTQILKQSVLKPASPGITLTSFYNQDVAVWLRRTRKLGTKPCEGLNPTINKIFFFNFRLFRVPRSWTGGVLMKSSMTFIRGNICIEREKIIL